MEESREILLNSMRGRGVLIPTSVSSIKDLTPTALVSICAQCLNLLDENASFSTSLPTDSVADRVRICTDIASAVKNLGFVGDISFHQFLYPSEENLCKLIRFLAEKISESPVSGRTAHNANISAGSKLREDKLKIDLDFSTEKADAEGIICNFSQLGAKLNDLRWEIQTPETLISNADAFANQADISPFKAKEMDVVAASDASGSSLAGVFKDETSAENDLEEVQVGTERGSGGYEVATGHVGGEDMRILKQKVRFDADNLQSQEKVLLDELTAMTSETEHLELEIELMKAAVDIGIDDQHSVDFHLNRLSEQLQDKKHYLLKLETEWDAERIPLEERKRSLEKSLFTNNPDAQEMIQRLREVEQEEQFILSEIRKRDEEYSELSGDLEKQPKIASRKSYVQRIKEITKNSRKLDADIELILKETRGVQLESNSIQERLHRTYAVADEMVFREAKKDPTGRQVYRLLTSIHEGFEQLSEKILATDRIRREIAEYEMKLAATDSRSLDVDKLQADLDAITRENEYLEQKPKHL